jgi:hypothetical protein
MTTCTSTTTTDARTRTRTGTATPPTGPFPTRNGPPKGPGLDGVFYHLPAPRPPQPQPRQPLPQNHVPRQIFFPSPRPPRATRHPTPSSVPFVATAKRTHGAQRPPRPPPPPLPSVFPRLLCAERITKRTHLRVFLRVFVPSWSPLLPARTPRRNEPNHPSATPHLRRSFLRPEPPFPIPLAAPSRDPIQSPRHFIDTVGNPRG